MPETDINSPQNSSSKPLDLLPEFATAFASEITATVEFRGDLTFEVKPVRLREMIRFLKTFERCPFNVMMDLFAMDYPKTTAEMPERYAVIYNLFSMNTNSRVRLKVFLPEATPAIDSIHDLYKAANWFEREAWDLFGIQFLGHPGLHRILCHDDFVGHPMRKDYPADGYQRLKSPIPSSGM